MSSSLELLGKGGRVSMIAYTGHSSGYTEKDAVREFVAQLDPSHYAVISICVLNRARPVPQLFLIEKVGI